MSASARLAAVAESPRAARRQGVILLPISETKGGENMSRENDGAPRRGILLQKWLLVRRAAADGTLGQAGLAVLIVLLDRFRAGDSDCWPSIDTIASDAGVARSTAIRAIGRLVQGAYLEITRGGGRGHSTHYRPRLETVASAPLIGGAEEGETVASAPLITRRKQ